MTSDRGNCRNERCGCLPSLSKDSGVNVVHFLRSFTSLSRQPCIQLLFIAFAILVLYRAGAAAGALDSYGAARFRVFKYEPAGDSAADASAAGEVVAFALTRAG